MGLGVKTNWWYTETADAEDDRNISNYSNSAFQIGVFRINSIEILILLIAVREFYNSGGISLL